MSRITLSTWPNGEDRLIVGWDHPAGGAFWQEFARETDENSRKIWEYDHDWQEVQREGGMWPGIKLNLFKERVPDDLRDLITDEVVDLLWKHSIDPESGRLPPISLIK
jgi:hypothetical protein